jgi:uncharacterized protein
LNDKSTILTLKINLRPDKKVEFAAWQALLNARLALFPGFLSIEFISPPNSAQSWIIVQRFGNPADLSSWIRSKEYTDLRSNLKNQFAQGDIKEELSEMSEAQHGVTEVFVTQISPEKESEYRNWIAKIHQVEATFPGFRGVYVQAPQKGIGKKFLQNRNP